MFGVLNAVTVPQGQIYADLETVQKELVQRMEKEGYRIVRARSHRPHTGGPEVPNNDIIRCDLVCDRGGRPYECRATKHKTSTKKTGCPWKAKAVNRKAAGGWVLTVVCDQHNHEPGTPEPPSPTQSGAYEHDVEEPEEDGPQADVETAAAIQVAGVSEAVLRLTGDTFHQFKADYRKMPEAERLTVLAHLQLRIAAIYAVQNEVVQRNTRQAAQEKRHREIEENKRAENNRRGLSEQQQKARIERQRQLLQRQQLSQRAQQLPQNGQPSQGQHLVQPSPFQMGHYTETFLPVPGFDGHADPDDSLVQRSPKRSRQGPQSRAVQPSVE